MNLEDFKLSDRSWAQRDEHAMTTVSGSELEQSDSQGRKDRGSCQGLEEEGMGIRV